MFHVDTYNHVSPPCTGTWGCMQQTFTQSKPFESNGPKLALVARSNWSTLSKSNTIHSSRYLVQSSPLVHPQRFTERTGELTHAAHTSLVPTQCYLDFILHHMIPSLLNNVAVLIMIK